MLRRSLTVRGWHIITVVAACSCFFLPWPCCRAAKCERAQTGNSCRPWCIVHLWPYKVPSLHNPFLGTWCSNFHDSFSKKFLFTDYHRRRRHCIMMAKKITKKKTNIDNNDPVVKAGLQKKKKKLIDDGGRWWSQKNKNKTVTIDLHSVTCRER